MKDVIKSRALSFLWRFGGMTFVSLAGFIIQAGDVFAMDWRQFANFSVITTLGLLVGEVTKFLNTDLSLKDE